MAGKPRLCGKMYSKGRVFDTCSLPHKHEGAHVAPRRGFTFDDKGGIVSYGESFNLPKPGLDQPQPNDAPGTMLPEPPKLTFPKVVDE